MDRSGVRVPYKRKLSFLDRIYGIGIMPPKRLRNVVKSLLDNGKTREVIHMYTHSYNRIVKADLEILVEEIGKKARENIIDYEHFSLDSFICFKCNDIITDPVTLKCGHTFSKKCALLEAKLNSFICRECNQIYDLFYLTQLKTNVAILSLIEKLSEKYLKHKVIAREAENNLYKIYESKSFLLNLEKETLTDVEHSNLYVLARTARGYFKKGKFLSSLGNFREAFKAYLTSLTLDSHAYHAKMSAVEILRRFLRNRAYSDCNLRSSGSNDSLHLPEDDRSSSDEEERKVELTRLHLVIENFVNSVKKLGDDMNIVSTIDTSLLDKRELECPLCMRILWEPITTTCGHTFCRVCLNRCFDHQPTCPLCKSSLIAFLAERDQKSTKFLEFIIKNVFPTDYFERQALFQEEMERLSNAGIDPEHEIPLFVCTVALPTVRCALHVFEPRYRLMIRQCMESGSMQFGICGVINDVIAECGTMLKIQHVKYFDDGRSVVYTVGSKRFRILRKGERDGYHTAGVEFLEDQPLTDIELLGIERKLKETYEIAMKWLSHLPIDTQQQIIDHFGHMPKVESNYTPSPDGPSWLWWMLAILPIEIRLKELIVSLTSLAHRLELLNAIVSYFARTISS